MLCMLIVASAAQSEKPLVTITVCEALAKYRDLNGRVIRVRGTYSPWEHGLFLRAEGCDNVLDSEGFHWPAAISVEGMQSALEAHGRSITTYVAITEKIGVAIRNALQAAGAACAARVTVTYAGLFESRCDLRQEPGHGFGALGAAPAQIFIDSVDDITVQVAP
jgi:hypothetical protein